MKAAPFEYHRPDSLHDAVEMLGTFGDEAKVIAGGQSLVPMLAMRLSIFEHLIDIARLDELAGIERRPGTGGSESLWLGAGTIEAAVEHDPEVASAAPLLARATPFIGHLQIRNRGTVGGSIAHADPAAEYPAVVLALDGELEAVSTRGRRVIPAGDFFTGLWTTALEPDELLAGVSLPIWTGRCGFAVEELARRHGDFAIAGATVAVELDGDDKVARCGIGLFGLGSTPVRATAAEAALVGRPVGEIEADEVGRASVAELDEVPSDLHGSADYRIRVGAAMVSRAWTTASTEASGA